MGFGLRSPPEGQDLARALLPPGFSAAIKVWGFFIPLFAFNLPFSMKIQRDLPPSWMLSLGAFCQGGARLQLSPE